MTPLNPQFIHDENGKPTFVVVTHKEFEALLNGEYVTYDKLSPEEQDAADIAELEQARKENAESTYLIEPLDPNNPEDAEDLELIRQADIENGDEPYIPWEDFIKTVDMDELKQAIISENGEDDARAAA